MRKRVAWNRRSVGDPVARPERADELEAAMALELERVTPVKSVIYMSGERDPRLGPLVKSRDPEFQNKLKLMGPDPRIARMPDRPTLIDFFRLRFAALHMLQLGAALARLNGLEDKVVLAVPVLHDIAVASGFYPRRSRLLGARR